MPARFPLAVLPTPVHRLHRLEDALGIGPLLIKRDDLVGFGVAGNKARPCEFLLGAARAADADVLVTGGGPGSNFCPAAALAARAAGLDCELILWGAPDDLNRSPNVTLARAAGACILPTGDTDRAAIDGLVEMRAADLRAAGRRPFPVPRGGSTALGAVGFATAVAELTTQLDVPPALIVIAVGSGGSCAGLLAGLAAAESSDPRAPTTRAPTSRVPAPGAPWSRTRVLGVSVSRSPEEIGAQVRTMAAGCAELIGGPPPPAAEIVDARGAGFGAASPHERERARLALHTEGLLFDETYGAQAFAAATDRLLAGERGPVLYWHTGGLVPAVASLRIISGTISGRNHG
jgi:1-aminocyclopropane-1-carboxylate deaminase/D-cysteine desulfhydrase-like pyridoxal-dependent ACC family enzyme